MAFLVLVAMVTMGSVLADYPTVSPNYRECSISQFGKLKMFSTELGNVELPCKYILAEMNCGDWHIKATGGSVSDVDYPFRYTPETLWVKIQSISNPNKAFFARTDTGNFDDRFPWNVKTELSRFRPSQFQYDESMQAAILAEPGVYSVHFYRNNKISIRCDDDKFSNTPYPESICGDPNGGLKQQAQNNNRLRRPIKNLGLATERSYGLTYHILNNTRVTQSTQCEGIARKLQNCVRRTESGEAQDGQNLQFEAITRCARVFSQRSVSSCLNRRPNTVNAFRLCIKTAGCNLDDNFTTGPAAVCDYYKERLTRFDCMDAWDEIAKDLNCEE